MFRDVPGSLNEQPFHLDGTVPWSQLQDGRVCTALSCVVLLGDAPGTVLGRLLSNFWEEFAGDDAAIAKFLNKHIAECDKAHDSTAKKAMVRAGTVVLFPLGESS